MQTQARRRQLDEARRKRWGSKSWHERFWEKVQFSTTGKCWEWQGAKTSMGYGQFQHGPRSSRITMYSHRHVYETFMGPIPEGLELDHLCRNPGCCNPSHLEAVTHQQNMSRSKAATKMSCKYGHDWSDPRNVHIRNNGRRWCAECNRTRWYKRRVRARLLPRRGYGDPVEAQHGGSS